MDNCRAMEVFNEATYSLHKIYSHSRIIWDTVIWPGGELELLHYPESLLVLKTNTIYEQLKCDQTLCNFIVPQN